MVTGESNLKIRRPLDLGAGMVGSAAAAHALVGVLRCEPPNPNLHYFAGRFTYRAPYGPRHSPCSPFFGPGQRHPGLRCTWQACAGLYGNLHMTETVKFQVTKES